MSLSFGLSKRVIENTLYNISVALPFICAFYIMNTAGVIVVPYTNVTIPYELTRFAEIIIIGLFYYFLVFCLIWFGSVSLMYENSKLSMVCAGILGISGVYAWFKRDHSPKVFIILSLLALVYILIVKISNRNDNNSSLIAMQICGGLLSLLCFVTGVLWFENVLLFQSFISNMFGLQIIKQESLRVGSVMLVTIGYVVLFSVFKGSEMWTDPERK